jgi:AAA family ATP:ADP antiporter
MVKSLLSILNVVEGEERPVLLVLGYGFFMGIFLAAYKVVATTLFLANMKEYIREAFFISGMLGVLSTWLYATLQNRFRFSKLMIFSIITIFLFIALLRSMFLIEDSNRYIFILFVMLGPITSLLILGFWGIFGRLFDLRQAKRMIGGIDSGQLAAIIITTFSIPFVIPYIGDIRNFLLIGEVGLAVSLVFVIAIVSNFKLTSFHQKRKEVKDQTKFSRIFKNRYIVYLSVFLFLSMSAFVFVDYSFMNVVEQQYPDERQLASFLGVFEGTIMILSLLIQTFVNERLLSMYGLKTSLLILPLILFIFTAVAIFTGQVFGFEVTNPTFIWFFLFIALSRLFITTLREATENPIFKLFFMPLDSRVRFDIQTKIEGTINELSRAISGGLILLLGLIPFIKLIHYSWILTLIIVGWVYMVYRIYHLYRVNIRMKLERQKAEADKVEQKGRTLLVNKLFNSIESDNPNLMIFALRALSKVAPDIFKDKIDSIKNDRSLAHKNKVIQTLEGDFSFIHVANNKQAGDFKKLPFQLKEGVESSASFGPEIHKMVQSEDKAERKLAAELMSVTNISDSVGLLIELHNDEDIGVVNAAMKTAAELKKVELLPFIFDNVQDQKFKDVAIDALIEYGELAFHNMEAIFYNSEHEVGIKNEIVNIYGKVGGDKAEELLWNKVDYPDKKVVTQVFLALSHCGYQAKPEQVQRVRLSIEDDIVSIIWNLRAVEQLSETEDDSYKEIVKALREENEYSYKHIYMLLSMIYDQKSIQLVRENIETNTNEGISYAIELLDVFLSDDLKQKIIPILDDTSDYDRVRRLQMFYPSLEVSAEELIRQIINRDYSQTNRWTKASVIKYLGEKANDRRYDMELISNLFNPDMLIKEMSAWAMYQIDPAFYRENLIRLEPEEQNMLRNLHFDIENESESDFMSHMRSDLVMFLKSETLLTELPSYILANIVDFVEDVHLDSNTIIRPSDWSNENFFIIFRGSLAVVTGTGERVHRFVRGDFLGEQINIDLLEEGSKFDISEDTVLLMIEKNRFLDLITNEYDVTLKLLDSFKTEVEVSAI